MKIYDLIIVGAGPAGITAAVYAARKKMDTLILTRDVGGQAAYSSDIQNYLGYQFITGPELVMKFRDHLEKFDVDIREGVEVKRVKRDGDRVNVQTDEGVYESICTIVASGRIPRHLGVDGEKEYKNRGVTYCATCDGPLFAGKDVAVIGGGNSALDAVLQLVRIANRIYLIDIADRLRADPVMVEKAEKSGKVNIYNGAGVEKIVGGQFVEGVTILRGSAIKDIAVQGIFIEIGSLPASDFVEDVKRNDTLEILVNCKCETSIPGIFAAGDVTNVPAKQIIVACGEGAKATLAAFEYFSKKT